jgi:hypothetical protein
MEIKKTIRKNIRNALIFVATIKKVKVIASGLSDLVALEDHL